VDESATSPSEVPAASETTEADVAPAQVPSFEASQQAMNAAVDDAALRAQVTLQPDGALHATEIMLSTAPEPECDPTGSAQRKAEEIATAPSEVPAAAETTNADVAAARAPSLEPLRQATNAAVDDGVWRPQFTLQPDGTLRCAEGKPLRRVERRGDRLLYQARPEDCNACPRALQCLRPGTRGVNGRSVMRRIDAPEIPLRQSLSWFRVTSPATKAASTGHPTGSAKAIAEAIATSSYEAPAASETPTRADVAPARAPSFEPLRQATAAAVDDGVWRPQFTLQPDGSLRCTEGKPLRRAKRRGNRLVFEARPEDCTACPRAPQCLRPGARGVKGRSVMRSIDAPETPLLGGSSRSRVASTAKRWARTGISSEPPGRPALAMVQTPPARPSLRPPGRPGALPLYWYDLPATALRRTLPRRLTLQCVDMNPENVEASPLHEILSRDQRAHRRLTWDERLARNRRPAGLPVVRLELHGVPLGLAAYLGIPSLG
jgi:hypothetical protein